MEDTIIVKTHYAYMLRADLPPVDTTQNVIIKNHMMDWLESSGSSFHLGGIEKGKETGKLHYQMIVWFENKLSNNEKNRLRNWWRGKCGRHKNNHAFTSARKVVNLSSYSTKEADKIITNLSPQQLNLIPKWQNKKALKENNKEKFHKLLKEKIETFRNSSVCTDKEVVKGYTPWDPYTNDINPDYETFCKLLNDAYFQVYGEECCYRNTYFKLAKRHGIISHRRFLVKIGVID